MHEVGVRLVTFGQSVEFYLDDIGYYNPSLIRFCGTMAEGTQVQLVQHVTQISILLMGVPLLPGREKRIGFLREDQDAAALDKEA